MLKRSKKRRRGGSLAAAHAPQHEQDTAWRLRGRVTPRSGAGTIKGDVRTGVVRVECKCTSAGSFRVTLDMWERIQEAAAQGGEHPVIEVRFLDGKGQPRATLVVMDAYSLEDMVACCSDD